MNAENLKVGDLIHIKRKAGYTFNIGLISYITPTLDIKVMWLGILQFQPRMSEKYYNWNDFLKWSSDPDWLHYPKK